MSKINIDSEHDPTTAIFWASFATEPGQQQRHCPTVILYQNSKGGQFFAVRKQPGIDPTRYELIEDPRTWLQEQIERLMPK